MLNVCIQRRCFVDMSMHSQAAFQAKAVSHPTCRVPVLSHPWQILKVLFEASHCDFALSFYTT